MRRGGEEEGGREKRTEVGTDREGKGVIRWRGKGSDREGGGGRRKR